MKTIPEPLQKSEISLFENNLSFIQLERVEFHSFGVVLEWVYSFWSGLVNETPFPSFCGCFTKFHSSESKIFTLLHLESSNIRCRQSTCPWKWEHFCSTEANHPFSQEDEFGI